MENANITLEDVNNLVNDLLVKRLEVADIENQIKEKTKDLEEQLEKLKTERDLLQEKLLETMSGNNLDSWKTTEATISVSRRYSASMAEWYKNQALERLKAGQEVDGFSLKESRFISIRPRK